MKKQLNRDCFPVDEGTKRMNKRKWMNCIFILLGCIGVYICVQYRYIVNMETQISAYQEEIVDITDKYEAEMFLIPEVELQQADVNIEEVYETINGEYHGNFPDELVKEFEGILLQNSLSDIPAMENNTEYFDILRSYGSDKYQVEITENEDNCLSMFRYKLEDREYVLEIIDSGGSAGYCHANLLELVNGESQLVSSFDIQNEGYGRVLCHEEQYYYVYLVYNYNLKYYDGVRIHRLGENVATENVCIRCIPDQYQWVNLFESRKYDAQEISEYLEQNRNSIVSRETMEIGQNAYRLKCIEDDCETAEEEWLKIDFANVGEAICFQRSIFIPSNRYNKLHIQGTFYFDDKNSKLEIDAATKNPLVQLWFKKINDKVYTFQIYHISGYNYLLCVRYVEGNRIIDVRQEYLMPEYRFEITEGKELWIGL